MQSVMGFTLLFMPKPKAGINGSGMHINMSLADQSGHNVFIDETDGLGTQPDSISVYGRDSCPHEGNNHADQSSGQIVPSVSFRDMMPRCM